MSEKVKNKLGVAGEFRDTVANTKFGDLETPFEFIPILMQKKWLEFDLIPSKSGAPKREYKQTLMIQDNPAAAGYNGDLPLKDDKNLIERDKVMDFFVLIPSEVKAGAALPYVLSFRRTSLRAGQTLATQMYVRNSAAGKVPAATVCTLAGVEKENDLGHFVVQQVAPKREATAEELNAAYEWFKRLTANMAAVKVDESDIKQESTQGSFSFDPMAPTTF